MNCFYVNISIATHFIVSIMYIFSMSFIFGFSAGTNTIVLIVIKHAA